MMSELFISSKQKIEPRTSDTNEAILKMTKGQIRIPNVFLFRSNKPIAIIRIMKQAMRNRNAM
jgi:hypothetical protein